MVRNSCIPTGSVIAPLFALLTVSPASAQSPAPPLSPEVVDRIFDRAEQLEAQDRALVQSQGPIERSGYSSPAPTFQLSTSSDETEVSIGLATEFGRTRSDRRGSVDRRVSTLTRFSIQGFAPVNENGDDVFVNLANPLDGARLKISLIRYVSRYTLTAEARDQMHRVLDASLQTCARRNTVAWAAGKPEDQRQLAERYLAAINREAASPQWAGGGFVSALNLLRDSPEFADLPPEVRSACLVGSVANSPASDQALIDSFGGGADPEAPIRAVAGNAPTYFFGIEGTVSHKTYSFIDRTAFEISEDGRVGYQVGAFAGVVAASGRWSLRAGISHSQRYGAADDIEFCRPAGSAGQSECLSAADGPPSRSRSTVFSLEGRHRFSLTGSLIPNIGVAPEFAYDFDSDEFSVDVPIYLAANSDGALTGGIRFGYGSKDDEFSFGVFVGVPFTVFR